jgi:hypothetical protein
MIEKKTLTFKERNEKVLRDLNKKNQQAKMRSLEESNRKAQVLAAAR